MKFPVWDSTSGFCFSVSIALFELPNITHFHEFTTHAHPPQYTLYEKSGVSDTTFPQFLICSPTYAQA